MKIHIIIFLIGYVAGAGTVAMLWALCRSAARPLPPAVEDDGLGRVVELGVAEIHCEVCGQLIPNGTLHTSTGTGYACKTCWPKGARQPLRSTTRCWPGGHGNDFSGGGR